MNNKFGEKIKYYRECHELSGRQLACQLLLAGTKISSKTLSKIECKAHVPTPGTLYKIAKVLKCTKNQLAELIELAKEQKINQYIKKINEKYCN